MPGRFLAVFRDDSGLHVERLSRAAFSILTALDATHSLERAMHRVTEAGRLRARDAERVGPWFTSWIARGWLCHARDERTHP